MENWLLFSAGDASADVYGARLIAALKRADPALKIAALGGPEMREVCDDFLFDLAGEGLVGFLEPIAKLPRLFSTLNKARGFLERKKPRALVCLDYYGFNRRLLGPAAEAGIPSYYYISPQVWASRPYRLKVLKRFIKKAFVIFPFERALYQEAGIACEFVGHPLLELLPPPVFKDSLTAPVRVGLLPGSRGPEIRRHLPIFSAAFEIFRRSFPRSKAFLFAPRTIPDSAYAGFKAGEVEIIRETDYKVRSRLHLALCSSGTATLENALLGVPMAAAYKLSWPTYFLARALIRVRHIAMPNILSGKTLVPEKIQSRATPQALAEALLDLVSSPSRYVALQKELSDLGTLLGGSGASERTARALLSELKIPATQPG